MRTHLNHPMTVPSRDWRLALYGLCLAAGCLMPQWVRGDEAAELEFFEKRIRPVLVRECYECHSAALPEPKGGLRVDYRAGLLSGGESGPTIVPGKPEDSSLVMALRHETLAMPPKKRLAAEVIDDFQQWIARGAFDPRDQPPDVATVTQLAWEAQLAERRLWWSLQPVREPSVPVSGADSPNSAEFSRDARSPANAIDAFVFARLRAAQLVPAARADRTTLIRRLSFALVGLPPTREAIDEFVHDSRPDAWESAVERMLSSPHFGERWARHWLDVVRYTDTYGYEWDMPAKGAWRYRDYVTRVFNDDTPIDQFFREQIAGDLLEHPRLDAQQRINVSRIGVMFFQMGEKRHGDSAEFNGIHQEMLDNKIDAFSKAFQGTTLSCARCHDHKLDPISQREYYALGGVFMSSRWITNTLDLPDRHTSQVERLERIKRELRGTVAKPWLLSLESLPGTMLAAAPDSPAIPKPVPREPANTAPVNTAPVSAAVSAESADSIAEAKKVFAVDLGKDLPLEDLLHPWQQILKGLEAGRPLPEIWQGLATRYAETRQARAASNAGHFRVVADFREGVPAGWSADGVGLMRPVSCGDFTVSLDGATAIGRLLPGGLYTNAVSPRFNGALRTPYLREFDKTFLSYEVAGGDFSAHRTVIDNAFLTEKQQYLNQPAPAWMMLSNHLEMKQRHIYREFATKTSNPNFPPRVGLGGACSDEQIADPRSWFGITRVVLHDLPSPPADELTRFSRLFQGEPPADLTQVAARYTEWIRSSLVAWSGGAATEDDVRVVNWALDLRLLPNRREMASEPRVGQLVDQYRQLERDLAEPQTVNGMADLDPGFDYALNVRGDYDQLGPEVPRGYAEVLGGSSDAFQGRGSGRRELAEIVVNPDHRLTARVFVNRVWHWLFGAGLVATTDEFGHLGDRPSHPELLDYLAARFVREGWSLKQLIRAIVLSQTWQQSNATRPEAVSADPDNRLWHHYPLRRLEAEAIRDAMLAVSQRLDVRLYGPPIDPPRQNEDPQKRLVSGPVDGNGRRSIYTKITIMEPPRFLATFNQPNPKIPTGKRDVTNTPAQSLTLLNDALVSALAEAWAKQLVTESHSGVRERVSDMFERALGRTPSGGELDRWSAAVTDLASLHQVPDPGSGAETVLRSVPVWKDTAHALFNTKEFIYVK